MVWHAAVSYTHLGKYLGGVPLMYDADERKVIIDAGDTHTLVYGATGSLKTRAVVMPTIKICLLYTSRCV